MKTTMSEIGEGCMTAAAETPWLVTALDARTALLV